MSAWFVGLPLDGTVRRVNKDRIVEYQQYGNNTNETRADVGNEYVYISLPVDQVDRLMGGVTLPEHVLGNGDKRKSSDILNAVAEGLNAITDNAAEWTPAQIQEHAQSLRVIIEELQ